MKKFISVILAICFIMSYIPSAFAENDFSLLYNLGIFVGDGDGNMRWEDNVSRSEFAKLAVMVSSYRDYVASGLLVSPFSDVPSTHWASAYIKTGVDNGLFTGYPDGKFRPDNIVTYEEALTMVLRALGYNDNDFGASYPYGQLGIAKNIGITYGTNLNIGDTLNRYNSAKIINNALDTKMKGSEQKLYTSFDCSKIENVTVIASNKEDASVNSRQIYTSKGTFYINPETFDYSTIGKYGTMYIKNGDTFMSFEGSGQTEEVYTVTDTMGSDIILDSAIKDIDEKTTVYYKSNNLTYAGSVSYAKKGDKFSIVKSADGTVDYCILYPKNNDNNADVNLLETYAVYSLIDSGLIVYANGVFSQVKIDDDVTAYLNATAGVYGSIKNSLELGDIIRIKRDKDNGIDYIKIDKNDIEGPVIVSANGWSLSGDTSGYMVLRDGERVSFSDIRKNDVVYYSNELKMVLAYNKTAIGTYEKAFPDKNSPVTVTVSGTEYGIETAQAFNDLSSNGKYKFGDTVKLLLGKDGKIAGIADNAMNSDVIGVATDISRKISMDSNGNEYTGYYVTLMLMDGNYAEYQTDRNYSLKNSVVKIRFKNGIGSLTKLSGLSNGISGKIDVQLYTFGKERLANDIKILDVRTTDPNKEGSCKTVFLQRLDGVNISSNNVLYYSKNGKGEISELVLNNVTGDTYSYGVVTGSNISKGEMISGYYTVDINGTKMTVSANNRAYNVSNGSAIGAEVINGNVDLIFPLVSLNSRITDIDDLYCFVGNTKYAFGENSVIYIRDSISTGYQKTSVSSLKKIIDNYNVYGYYDKSEQNGGRIRVILAEKR